MRSLVFALALLAPVAAQAAPPKGFDARVEQVRKELEAPGLAIAIVEDGKVTLSRGYGTKSLGGKDRVDAGTIFQIGSVSKAFTAVALATLVDQGKLKWDDRVIDHMPGFRMYDPWVTREITVRDLLVHRSGLGLGQGDLMFVPATTISRAETVRRLQYLKPVTSFRSSYAYDNVLYVVAGQLIEDVTGQTWEDYVRDHVLKPAGMTASVTNDPDRHVAPNRALPHGRTSGELRGMGPQLALDEKGVTLGANAAPAGAIAASADDMARWLQVQLAGGVAPDGKRVFSAESAAEMWKPVVPMPISPLPGPLAGITSNFKAYALGWNVQDYKGVKVIEHGGATLGFRAMIMIIPEKKVGVVIMTNSEESALLRGLEYELADHYLGRPKQDWTHDFQAWLDDRNTQGLAFVRKSAAARPPASKPSLPLASYAGAYADPWYGPIAIREAGGKLSIDFQQTPGMTGPLEPYAFDTFIARWKDPGTEPAFVTFSLGADGKPERITMKPVSPIADFSFDYQDLLFTPVAAAN